MMAMTSATEGGGAQTGAQTAGGDIALSSAAGDPSSSTSHKWWPAAALAVLAAGIILWQTGSDNEPSALVTSTYPSATTETGSLAPTPTDSIATTLPATTDPSADGRGTPTSTDDDPSTTVERPVVPASTSPPTVAATAPPTRPATIVVSPDADPTAPQVSLVDEAVTEAIVIQPVPNTSLDGADRTPVVAAPTTSTARLACDSAPIRLDADSLVGAEAIRAENADGTAATLALSDAGIGVVGGRVAEHIDYSAQRGASERVFIDLGGSRCAVALEVGDFDPDEWNGIDESLHWVGLDRNNVTVGEGWSNATAERPIALDLVAPIERLLLEAAPYGATVDGWPAGADREAADNSDFVLVAIIVR